LKVQEWILKVRQALFKFENWKLKFRQAIFNFQNRATKFRQPFLKVQEWILKVQQALFKFEKWELKFRQAVFKLFWASPDSQKPNQAFMRTATAVQLRPDIIPDSLIFFYRNMCI